MNYISITQTRTDEHNKTILDETGRDFPLPLVGTNLTAHLAMDNGKQVLVCRVSSEELSDTHGLYIYCKHVTGVKYADISYFLLPNTCEPMVNDLLRGHEILPFLRDKGTEYALTESDSHKRGTTELHTYVFASLTSLQVPEEALPPVTLSKSWDIL